MPPTIHHSLDARNSQGAQHSIKQLTLSIQTLSPQISNQEANLFAKTAINYSLELGKQYQVGKNPLWHNILVNLGIKERGLCVHWTEDLLRKLSKLNIPSLKLYWAVANRNDGSFNLEHSAIVVTVTDKEFEQGIVLDAWRDSGKLYFSSIQDDSYQWQKHFNDITEQLLLNSL
ncbi:MAG: hypothetical protein HWD86_09145 [Kangiellaceae bacterium]|nr:hypothetical protein [Kangiellaceae bacterium]